MGIICNSRFSFNKSTRLDLYNSLTKPYFEYTFAAWGGTGKTIRLLQLAKQLHNDSSSRILILTYNHALISNLKRLLYLSGISSNLSEQKFIVFQTIHSFMRNVMKKHDLIDLADDKFLEDYDKNLKDLFID